MIDIPNSSSMLVDWNKGVSCVGQSVPDVEVENVENDDGIEADNNQDYKWRGDDNEQLKCFLIVCLSAMLYFGKYHSFRRKCATQLTNKPFFREHHINNKLATAKTQTQETNNPPKIIPSTNALTITIKIRQHELRKDT